jgi:O-antigen/teichoic acid export membrane protein
VIKFIRSSTVLCLAPVAGFFVVLAVTRALPVEQAAVFLLLQAIIPIASEFLGFGLSDHMMREVAKDSTTYAVHLRRFLTVTIVAAFPLSLIASLFSVLMLDVKFTAIILFAIVVDAVASRIIIFVEQASLAQGKLGLADLARLLGTVSRLFGVSVYIYIVGGRDGQVSALYSASSLLLSALPIFIYLNKNDIFSSFGRFAIDYKIIAFYANNILRVFQQNMDRIVMAGLLSPVGFASYVIVSRLVQVSLIPTVSILRQYFPQFVQAYKAGALQLRSYALSRLSIFVTTGALGAAGMLFVGRFMPGLFGEKLGMPGAFFYAAAGVPIIFSIQYLFLEVLTAADRQGQRSTIVLAQIFLQAISQCLLARSFGVFGAIGGLYVSVLISLSISVLAALRVLSNRGPVYVK